jgi:putative DNA methylase
LVSGTTASREPAGLPTAAQAGTDSVPIDEAFDVEFADQIAQLESYNKHHYRPNTYLHKWWARRCGSTFRLILKGLVDDPARRDYYAAGGLEGKVILDPMMGGGTTLHEAIRLGASVVGGDLDPIPVLQARATLSPIAAETLQRAFATFHSALRARLAPLFQTRCPVCQGPAEVRFILYGVRRTCACGPAVLIDSTILRTESDGRTTRLCPRCRRILQSSPCSCGRESFPVPIVQKTPRCATCGERYEELLDVPYYARYEPVAIASQCEDHGFGFGEVTADDRALLATAEAQRPRLQGAELAIQPGPKSDDLLRRGILRYSDLFSARQLLYVEEARRQLEGLDEQVRLNLALLVSTSLEFNSLLCGYKGGSQHRPGAIRHAFAHHAYSPPYTALENNPVARRRSSGTLFKLYHDRIRRARRWALAPVERRVERGRPVIVPVAGEIDQGSEVRDAAALRTGGRRFLLLQGSSTRLGLPDGSIDAIVTDPPYYDHVQYSDLAGFFRVWLRRLIPGSADWDVDLGQAAVDPHGNGGNQYGDVLTGIWAECHRVLAQERGRLVFTFHHWRPEAWIALSLALRRAGFELVSHYVVHSENPTSVHIAGLRSLRHDAILVLAPRGSTHGPKKDLPASVRLNDSRAFCQDCASVLGWVLHADLSEAEIAALWVTALEPGDQRTEGRA